MTWLAHAGPAASGPDADAAVVLVGPGVRAARSPSRINGVLTAVRGMVVHAVADGQAPSRLVPLLYEVADDRDLPEQARDADGAMAWETGVTPRGSTSPPGPRNGQVAGTTLPREHVRAPVEWKKIFTDQRLCQAVVDRITFQGTFINTGTDSYRLAATEAKLRRE